MKAIILDALDLRGDFNPAEHLGKALETKGWQQEIFRLEDMDIKPCTSCGGCASRTPGRCSIKDDMEKIYRGWVNSQLVILCTPVSFGGYHSRLKTVIDRAMPLNLAYFSFRRGEMHHRNRYDPTPSLMTVGFLGEESSLEANIFQLLTERNAVNMNIHRRASLVVTPRETLSDIHRLFREVLEEVTK